MQIYARKYRLVCKCLFNIGVSNTLLTCQDIRSPANENCIFGAVNVSSPPKPRDSHVEETRVTMTTDATLREDGEEG